MLIGELCFELKRWSLANTSVFELWLEFISSNFWWIGQWFVIRKNYEASAFQNVSGMLNRSFSEEEYLDSAGVSLLEKKVISF